MAWPAFGRGSPDALGVAATLLLLTPALSAWSQGPAGTQPQPGPPAFTIEERADGFSLRLRARRTSTLQPLERQLVLRATELLAHRLCNFTPQPGRVLAASLKGVTVVSSTERQGVLEIVVEAPKQEPACDVRVGARAATPAADLLGPASPSRPPAAPGISVQHYKGEL